MHTTRTNTEVNNQQELENKKFFKRTHQLNTAIVFIFCFIFIFASTVVLGFMPDNISWYWLYLIIFATFTGSYITGWLVTFPLRIFMYKICTKHEVLTQEFKPWVIDWLKVFVVNIVFSMPLLSVAAIICFNQKNHIYLSIFNFAILFIIITIVKRYLMVWFIHGFYILKSGSYYDYWNSIINKQNIQNYPIFIIPIEAKAKWANAFAFGFKNFGFIYSTDVLLNNLDERQFSAILAHEAAHLEFNDVLFRFAFSFILLILWLVVFSNIDYIPENYNLAGFIVIVLFFILLVYSSLIMAKNQEARADKYSVKLLSSPYYLIESLDYLYDINKMPKDPKNHGKFKIHPTLAERKQAMIDYYENHVR
ncbi:MAG: M48 family metalloprotease [Cyanobacteriota bacterium]